MPPKKTAGPPPHQKSDAIKPGTTFPDNNKRVVTVGKELAQGGFGRICDVKVDGVTGPLIGKFEPGGNGPLFVEQSVFTRILRKESLDKFASDHSINFLGLPHVVSNGMYNDIRYLVMPKYSHCLDQIIKKKGPLLMKNVKQVLHCVFSALEYMHRSDYAHADIKAGNLMMNSEAAFDRVYLIDFGLCMRADKAVDKDNKKRAHNGTPFFTSTDAHRGIGPTYRGDIEILGHNVIYWLSGKIPWEKHENNLDEIFNAKKTLIANLDKGLSQAGVSNNDKELVSAIFKEASRLGVVEIPDFNKLHNAVNRASDGAGKSKTATRKEKSRDDLTEIKEEPVRRSRGRRNEEPSEEVDEDAAAPTSRRRDKQKKAPENISEDVVPPKTSRITKDRRTTTESDDEAPESIIPGLNKKNRPPTAVAVAASPAKVIPGMRGRASGNKRRADESTLSAKPRSRSNRLLESEISNRQGKSACRTVTPPPRHFPMDARSLPRPEKKPICRVDVIDGSPEVAQSMRHRSARLRSISPDHPPSKSARGSRPWPTSSSSFETPQLKDRSLRSILPSSVRTLDSPVSKSTPIRRGRVPSGNPDDLENASPEYKVVRVERPTGCALIMKAILVLLALFAVSCLASDPNSKLKKCCRKIKNEDKECITRFCDFDSISQTNVLNYLSTCTERGEVVGKMWDCASSRVDHTECCKAKGVEGKCLEYCAAHDGVPTNYLSYLTCLENFNEIRDCFKDYMEAH